ncbi:MAG: PQQ-binding-like beta-propeller repeat protein [Candidatus Daviesbacteria bacterium]|nr:PQQ-binding-like beta-propeller repeat protein [Candidatus Daviesbacteria bacterium]
MNYKAIALVTLFLLVLFGIYYSNSSKKISLSQPAKVNLSEWPSANQNFSNTRSALNATIDLTNISNLKPFWSFPIKGISEWGAATTNPIIIDNIVYFQDLKSNIYAVDFESGKQIWEKEYNLDIAGPAGVSIENGMIFGIKGHFEIVGLDLQGKELWATNLSENQNIGIDIQTTAQGGKVYVSTVPGVSNENFYKGGAIGILYALDQKTGKILWSFNTVDSKDIWGNKDVNSGGGAWYPPAIDTEKGILYWGLGNPAPWPGTKDFPNGSSRLGPNLYTNSLVALNQQDGKLLWYNQVLPHDLFDYDLQVSPILTTLDISGSKKEVIIGAGKMGKVYLFDRENGKTIWETSVGQHLNDNLKILPVGVTKVSPGPLGGVETNMAYSDNMIFVPIVNMVVEYTPSELVAKSFDLGTGKGELVALDAVSGKILWSNQFDSINVGAATVVNDLVFTATFNGKIYAFNKKTGEKVWEYQAPGGINGWPAVKDNTIIFPVGMGKNPILLAFKIGANGIIPSSSPLPPAGAGKGFGQ